jgi:hypothetical protein
MEYLDAHFTIALAGSGKGFDGEPLAVTTAEVALELTNMRKHNEKIKGIKKENSPI